MVWRPLRSITWAVVHQTGGDPLESPERMARRFAGWPIYHWLVYETGEILRLAAPTRFLYHVTERNKASLGIGVVGDYTQTPPPERLLSALDDLIGYLHRTHPQIQSVVAHSQLDHRSKCPGPHLEAWLRAQHHMGMIPVTRRASCRTALAAP